MTLRVGAFMKNNYKFKELWTLDPNVVFLNHGSFGACPKAILKEQDRLRRDLEKEPIQFMDEALFASGDTLYCLGVTVDGTAFEEWRFTARSHVGQPVIADVEGTGHASIIFGAGDGFIYCISE